MRIAQAMVNGIVAQGIPSDQAGELQDLVAKIEAEGK